MSRTEFWESIAIIICMLLWWPIIAGFRPAWYWWSASVLCLTVLTAILVRRWKRMKIAFDEQEREKERQEQEGRPKLPGQM